jgi:hypothetical protein
MIISNHAKFSILIPKLSDMGIAHTYNVLGNEQEKPNVASNTTIKAPSKLWYWTQQYIYNSEKLLDS